MRVVVGKLSEMAPKFPPVPTDSHYIPTTTSSLASWLLVACNIKIRTKFFFCEVKLRETAPGKSFPATSGKEELYNKLLFYIPKYLFSSTTTTNQNYSFVREKLHPAPPRKLLFLQKHPCVISWLPCKKAGKSCFDGNKRPATNA